jgi:hypothetical protein
MLWSQIPIDQIRAISRGAPGFHKDLARRLHEGEEPQIHVVRIVFEECEPCWFVLIESQNSSKLCGVDKSNLDTMAALVPIYLTEFVQHVRAELPEVFAIEGFQKGVEMLVPFQRKPKKEMPS